MSELITQNTFNVRIQKQDLEQVIKLADLLVQEITLTIDPEGMTLRTMDPSHVALLDIAMPNSLFEKYEVNGINNFGIRTDEILNLVKEFDKKDFISMRINADNNLILENHELSYSVRLIESVENNCPLPKIPYDSLVTIPGNDLKKYLSKLNVVSEYLTISTDNYNCILGSKGDLGECKIRLEKGMEQLIEIVTKLNSSGTYSLEYLMPYFKAMLTNTSHQLEFSSQKPLRVNSKIFNIGHCHFYLAPRVEN